MTTECDCLTATTSQRLDALVRRVAALEDRLDRGNASARSDALADVMAAVHDRLDSIEGRLYTLEARAHGT